MGDQSAVGRQANYREMASAIRVLTMDAVEAAKSGHPGLPMGMADVATVLFSEALAFDPAEPDWVNRDLCSDLKGVALPSSCQAAQRLRSRSGDINRSADI